MTQGAGSIQIFVEIPQMTTVKSNKCVSSTMNFSFRSFSHGSGYFVNPKSVCIKIAF